jgi:hypothetical protein
MLLGYRLPALLVVCCLSSAARAESYGPYEDLFDFDRAGVVFTDVRKTASKDKDSVVVTVWTRKSELDLTLLAARPERPAASPRLTPGWTRTLFKQELPNLPAVVRTSSSAVALLSYHGLNAGLLKREPAIQIFSFDGKRRVALKLDELFANGWERWHWRLNGGSVKWYGGAWFDRSGRRLFIMTGEDFSSERKREAVIVDLDTGKVEPVDNAAIKRELSVVEPRFLDAAFELAMSRGVDGLDPIAEKLFNDAGGPIAAKFCAAAYLEKKGNQAAAKLLDEFAAFQKLENWQDAKHPLIPTDVDDDFWWATVNYSAALRWRQKHEAGR